MGQPQQPASALLGLRVLDLTGRNGGYCGRLLANLGADVVLIEPPEGDPMRREGPFKNNAAHPEGSLSFASRHTNKRSIVLDLESAHDRQTLSRLSAGADVMIEDKAAGYLDERGLRFDSLRIINPALVLTSISGFGLSGPYREFKAPNIVAFAMGGLMNLCGHPGRAPLVGPGEIAYQLASVHAAFGTLVALYNRRATGRGDHVEISVQDVLVADPFLRIVMRYSVTGEILERTGHSQATTVAETYKCSDGYARIFCNQPDHWRRLVEWLGSPPELLDPKLENVQNRFPLRPMLDRLIETRTVNYDTKSFFEEFQSKRLAASPINPPSAFLRDDQTAHRGFIAEVDHCYFGRHRFPGDPYKFSESPWQIARGAPLLGEHQEAIAEELSRPSRWSDGLGDRATAGDKKALPFGGIRVVSFPTGIVGPALGSLLAEQGAEVISIEPGRALRSPQRGQRFQIASDLESHRNQKRLAINMKHPEGVALAERLIAISDVVAENFSARVMASWGLDYPRMKEVRQDIIMASLQAFGQTGPRREFVSFGPILMAFSGMTYLWRDPEIERPGAACQTAFPDYIAPSFGALAISAALHYRARTGKGQYVDISQAETAAALLTPAFLEWLINGREPEPQGNFSLYAAPHGCYRCKGDDRWCVIAVETQQEWERFCKVIGHSEWITDPRFVDLSARLSYRRELDGLVESWMKEHTPHQVMVILQREGIPAGVVQTAEDLYRDPHLRERGFARDVYHPEVGWLTRVGRSVRLKESDVTRPETVHQAGEDNEAVLGELLGLSTVQIKDLAQRQVLR
ncbi:MAG TPA: CoA transferase [Candidatus Binatia bacterium]|nr:CoA transferase [Candidatus Binatia bacterium]